MEITYSNSVVPTVEAIIDLYEHAGYFPFEDKSDTERIRIMHKNATLLVTAWDGNLLVGMARSLCDFSYCCYLSDVCVRDDYKQRGIGKELIIQTKQFAGRQCKLILQSSPVSIDFYKRIGMTQIDTAFIFKRDY